MRFLIKAYHIMQNVVLKIRSVNFHCYSYLPERRKEMKKVTLLGVIFILIAATAIPVMAASSGNGHGNGNNQGQGNSANAHDQTGDNNQDQTKIKNRNQINHPGFNGNGNQSQMRMRTPFYLQGTITAVDTVSQTLTVNLYHGNAQVKQYLGADLELQASDTTMIFKISQGDDNEGDGTGGTTGQTPTTSNNTAITDENEGPSNRVPITFDQLKVEIGQNVAIHGNVVDTVFTVRLITVYIQMPIGQPIIEKP
jgi:hypothetical protein